MNLIFVAKHSDSLMFSDFSPAGNSYKISEISIHSLSNQNVQEFEMDEFVVGTTDQPQKADNKKLKKRRSKKKLKENINEFKKRNSQTRVRRKM